MFCPNCKDKKIAKEIKISGIELGYCSNCQGLWFEKDELRLIKDKKHKDLKWLDFEIKDKALNWYNFDLWKDKVKFQLAKDQRICPHCQVPLCKVNYNDSQVEIDVCSVCFGIWLDRGEFKKILEYIRDKADYELLYNYTKNLAEEFKKVFIGPEKLRSEVVDFLIIAKLLKYKFAAQHPILTKLFSNLPLT